MTTRRVFRLNSLLKEVISEVLRHDLHHIVGLPALLTITSVEITADLSFAKIFFSVIGDEQAKERATVVLNELASQVAHLASRKVRLRQFPKLRFYRDEGLEKQQRICEIFAKVVPPSKETPQSEVEDTI